MAIRLHFFHSQFNPVTPSLLTTKLYMLCLRMERWLPYAENDCECDMGRLHPILRKSVVKHNLLNGYDLHMVEDSILTCALTFWFFVVSRYQSRIWSRQPDSWCRHCMSGSVTWLPRTRHSPAPHLISCILWFQAAHVCWKIFSMKIVRLLKVNVWNWINILSSSMVHLPGFVSPCR